MVKARNQLASYVATLSLAATLPFISADALSHTPTDPPPESERATSEARVALTPILSHPAETPETTPPALKPGAAQSTFTPQASIPPSVGGMYVNRAYMSGSYQPLSFFRLKPQPLFLLWQGAEQTESEPEVRPLFLLRTPALPPVDSGQSPLFADRTNIHLNSNIPGDHSESHFNVARLELAQGFFFRTEGTTRSYTPESRYLTLSAEAYISITERSGFAFGLDVLRAGLPEETFTRPEDSIFARFQFDF